MTETLNLQRIGVYGGTFDPIHNGHLAVARAVTAKFALDRLWIVPAHRPPHKQRSELASPYHRFAMAVLATLEEPRMTVSTVELEAPERPYSYQTVEGLRARYGETARLYFIIGADSYADMHKWREPARLMAAADIVVAARPGHDISGVRLPEGVEARVIDLRGHAGAAPIEERRAAESLVYLTDDALFDISGTEIRRRAGQGRSVRDLVAPAVADFIENYQLYKAVNGWVV